MAPNPIKPAAASYGTTPPRFDRPTGCEVSRSRDYRRGAQIAPGPSSCGGRGQNVASVRPRRSPPRAPPRGVRCRRPLSSNYASDRAAPVWKPIRSRCKRPNVANRNTTAQSNSRRPARPHKSRLIGSVEHFGLPKQTVANDMGKHRAGAEPPPAGPNGFDAAANRELIALYEKRAEADRDRRSARTG